MKKPTPTELLAQKQTLDKIEQIYHSHSTEQPESGIDRQIMAAAQRELNQPNPREKLKVSWWRRLSLPLYATATFTFTAIAAHWLWPAPVRVLPGTSPGPVVIDMINLKQEQPQASLLKERKVLEAPKTKKLATRPLKPETQLANSDDVMSSEGMELEELEIGHVKLKALELENEESMKQAFPQASQVEDNSYNDEVLYPDKEQWAREIIQLVKNGQHQAAKEQLIMFKKHFPDYPIDEQIKSFR